MLKTSKAVKKRFKITKTGKVLYRPAGISHFLAKKSGTQKRRNLKMVELKGPLVKKIKRMLPYN